IPPTPPSTAPSTSRSIAWRYFCATARPRRRRRHMARRRLEVIDRSGRLVDDDDAFDARGVIRDGYGLRGPLMLADSNQKAVKSDARGKKVTQFHPFGRVKSTFEEEEADSMMTDAEFALHRPGYRTSTAVNDDAAVEAYHQYVADQANAWKKRD